MRRLQPTYFGLVLGNLSLQAIHAADFPVRFGCPFYNKRQGVSKSTHNQLSQQMEPYLGFTTNTLPGLFSVCHFDPEESIPQSVLNPNQQHLIQSDGQVLRSQASHLVGIG